MAFPMNLFFTSCCLVIILLPAIVHPAPVCESDECQNGGTCTPTTGGTTGTEYMCTCTAQYVGVNCETALNGCDSNPCQSGGTCTNSANMAYTCSCMTGRTGTHCETISDSCASSPCLNGGQCSTTSTGGYMCTCTEGRTGTNCDTYTDKCNPSPCMFNGVCENNDDGTYTCSCTAGRTGTQCQSELDPCTSTPCMNGGTCGSNADGTYSCSCPSGKTGNQCQTISDSCASSPCLNGGQCSTMSTGGYMCTCTEGRTGTNCDTYTDKCDPSPCMFDGVCENHDDGTYTCSCTAGRTGTQCQSALDPCFSTPCMNGGTCGSDTDGTYSCSCPNGKTGNQCQTMVDPCQAQPCMYEGTCTATTTGGYTCSCVALRGGMRCQNLNQCNPNRCQNGGTCIDTAGLSSSCNCPPGYTGTTCETEIQTVSGENCPDEQCQNDGTCTDDKCVCPSGTTGVYCQSAVGPTSVNCDVSDSPCQNGGTCTDDNTCTCPPGTQGHLCEIVNNICDTMPCFYNGTCTDTGIGTYSCLCPPHHTGDRCETRLGCILYPCVRGDCVSTTTTARKCINCPPPYTGNACEAVMVITDVTLRLKVTLNTPWQMEFATNWTRLNAATQTLTEHLMNLICTEEACVNFTLIGASPCPGTLRVHYMIRLSSGSTTVDAKDKLKKFIMNDETLTNLNIKEKPEMITETKPDKLVIEDVKPTYGPLAGGTSVSICGYNLKAVTVRFGDQNCKIMSRYDLFVICKTAALSPVSEPVNTQLELKISNVTGEAMSQSVRTFTYMLDPTVDSIEPNVTVKGGGLLATIRGANLNSVYAPQLIATANNGEVTQEFTTPCTIVNSTQINCPYPDIRKFPQSGRSRRSIQEISSRYKRNTQDANVTVMVGVKLDGVTQYNEYAEITVHDDPIIKTFKEAGRRDTWTLRTYSRNPEETIDITGERLTTVFKQSDYNVMAGNKPCKISSTTNERIVCKPENQPGDLKVLVSYGVGRDPIHVGNIRFENSVWDNAPSKYAIISAIVVFVLILLIGIGFCCFNDMQQKRRLAGARPQTAARTFLRSRDSRYSRKKIRDSIHKTLGNFFPASTSRGGKDLFRQNQDVLSLTSSPNTSATSTPNTSARPSDASMIGIPMPEARFSPNYERAATGKAPGNIFLRHFSKFVTTRRPSQGDPVYDVINHENAAFQHEDELHGIRLSCMSIDDESLDGKGKEEMNSYATQLPFNEQPFYMQPSTSSSIHPPPKENDIMAAPTPLPTPPPSEFAPPPPPPPPPPPAAVRY